MVVGNHLFSFFDKKFREGVTRYELHPPSLRTVYFPTAPFFIWKYSPGNNVCRILHLRRVSLAASSFLLLPDSARQGYSM